MVIKKLFYLQFIFSFIIYKTNVVHLKYYPILMLSDVEAINVVILSLILIIQSASSTARWCAMEEGWAAETVKRRQREAEHRDAEDDDAKMI